MKLCNEALILPPQGVASSLNVTGGWGGGGEEERQVGQEFEKGNCEKTEII